MSEPQNIVSIVQARWNSQRDTSVPMTNAQVVGFANGTGVSCFHHEVLAAPAVLRRIAAALPTNDAADRLVDQELSRAYAAVPSRKLRR
jgi:hypothetical protein